MPNQPHPHVESALRTVDAGHGDWPTVARVLASEVRRLTAITPAPYAARVDRDAHAAEAERLARLSDSERDVLAGLQAGLTPHEVARERSTSIGTVRTQIRAIHRKLRVSSQLAAVALANRHHPAADREEAASGPA